MRLLRRALVALAVTAIVLVLVAEVAGRIAVERIASDELRRAGVARKVDVVVGEAWWKPSVVPALFGADLDRVTVRLDDAEMHPLTARRADYLLEGLDVAISLRSRTVEAKGLRAGLVSILVDADQVTEQLGFDAVVDGDRVLVGPDGAPAELRVEEGDLVVTSDAFAADGGSVRLPVIDSYVLPCEPDVRVVAGRVVLRCSTTELPGVIAQHLAPPVTIDPDAPEPPVELEPPVTAEVGPDGSTSTTTAPSTTETTTTTETTRPGG